MKHSDRVGIIALKFHRSRSHFLSDVFAAVAVVSILNSLFAKRETAGSGYENALRRKTIGLSCRICLTLRTSEPLIFMTSVQIPPLHGPRIVWFISQ